MSVRIIEWQFEDGTTLHQLREPEIDGLLGLDLPNSHCIQYLDPYGDLILNRCQVSALEDELRDIINGGAAQSIKEQAKTVLAFAEKLEPEDRTHHYLKFIGD